MPSFTGKGNRPHQGGNESAGQARKPGVGDVHGGLSRPSFRGCLRKSHWQKGPRKGQHRGFLPSFAMVTPDHTSQKQKVEVSG